VTAFIENGGYRESSGGAAVRRAVALIVVFSCWAVLQAFAQEELSVQVREAELRSSASYLGGIVATLSYGDRVTVLEQGEAWYRVSAGGRKGWLHQSAVTEKRIVLEAGDEDVETGASKTEVALAGRGFNEEVESRYKSKHDLDYRTIDELESSYSLSHEELLSFLREGGLETPAGDDDESGGNGGAQ
jgi:uncharacterized protein YgiM (DUF1202 family)